LVDLFEYMMMHGLTNPKFKGNCAFYLTFPSSAANRKGILHYGYFKRWYKLKQSGFFSVATLSIFACTYRITRPENVVGI